MKSLLVYLKNYKKESFFAPLFKMLEAIFELIVPLVVSSVIDNGILRNDYRKVLYDVGIMVVLAVVGMSVSVTAQYFAAKAAAGFGRELRSDLFKKIQSLSFSELDSAGTSTLVTIMTNDTAQVQNGVNMVLRLFLRSPFIVFGALVMAFTIDVQCALIFLVTIPILTVVIVAIMRYTMPRYRSIQFHLDELTLKTRENLSGARVIRAFTREAEETESFFEKNKALSHLQKAVGRISALMNPLTYVIINVAIIVLIYEGGVRVDAGDLSQGQVVALYNYMSQILVELIKLANLIVTVTRSFACASRIENVFKLQNSLQHSDNTVKANDYAVCFDHVSLKYNGSSEESLKDIDFRANKGDIIGIIGGTGSGKTSLVSLIPHFYDATEGTVYVNGVDVKAQEDHLLRNKIGFVLQKAALFKGTVRDNLLWGNKNATDDEMRAALKDAQVLDTINEKGGLDAEIKQNGANFSGGQKQRLSVARALVRKPEILILDDSSSALDFATEAAMRKAILNLSYKPTVFIVSQRASSVMFADQIIVLDDGECVGCGTHADLLNNCEVYREIYESQFQKEAAAK
ncbi:MAG TPA: ABC transporter ATP-binding protein/permease [Candidatus Eubacterium faecale]|uniref:ABC transporter ATP-binding protein/permease n=1 Tax=Candidatus Eubacterium faecale TaxID=2838568 RepID=A0A9D2MIG7_9FIRM|nr:ABC transporter ATP-binding protein/permease [Candidatus Eubacterium faecale]